MVLRNLFLKIQHYSMWFKIIDEIDSMQVFKKRAWILFAHDLLVNYLKICGEYSIPVLYIIGTFLKGLEIINDEILLNEDGKILIN